MPATLHKKLKRTLHSLTSIPDALAIKPYESIEGFLSPREALGLYQTARRIRPNPTLLEIGSWKGKSTFCLAKALRNGKIIAVDPFNCHGDPESSAIYNNQKGQLPLLEQFKNNMQSRGVLHRIEIWQGTSPQFVHLLPPLNGLDLLFIDGDHSIPGATYDFEHYAPHLRPGGFILFHDFDKNREDLGPTWVINHLVRPNPQWKWVACYDSLWIAQKLKN